MLHRENRIKKYHLSSAADLIKETMDYYSIILNDLTEVLFILWSSSLLNQTSDKVTKEKGLS